MISLRSLNIIVAPIAQNLAAVGLYSTQLWLSFTIWMQTGVDWGTSRYELSIN